jgi:hypothetical protein
MTELITDTEIDYIKKVFRHGLEHLEDGMPDKLFCVHSIHWCVEYLLKKWAENKNDVSWSDGFDKVFTKFRKRHGSSIPPDTINPVSSLNTFRNGMEHRGDNVDYTQLKEELIPMTAKFIKWFINTIMSKDVDLYSIPTTDIKKIKASFLVWKELFLPKESYIGIEPHLHTSQFESIPVDIIDGDKIFICIIPSTFSNGLVDLMKKSNENNPYADPDLEAYFKTHDIFRYSQSLTTPEAFYQYYQRRGDDRPSEDALIFPDGRAYLRMRNGGLWFAQRDENIELANVFGSVCVFIPSILNTDNGYYIKEKLRVLLYPFTISCNDIDAVTRRTDDFTIIFVFTRMIWGQNHSHRLFHDGINGFNFMGHEYYMGFDPDLIVQENFKYDEIDLMLARVKEQVKQYFRNPSSIGYG